MFTQISNAHTEVVTSLGFSPHVASSGEGGSGGLLCSTSGDDTAALWDLRAGSGASQRAAHLTGHHLGPVNHALFHPTDPYSLLTASDDRSLACWDLRRPERAVGVVTGFLEGVNKLLWLPVASSGCGTGSGWSIVSACDDGHVYVHALVLPDGTASARAPESAPAAAVVAGRPASGLPQVGVLVDKFRVSTSTVNDIVLAPNSTSVLITASEDCALRSWSLRHAQRPAGPAAGGVAGGGLMEDRLLATLDEFENPVNHVAVVPRGLMAPVERGAEAGAGSRPRDDGGEDDSGAGGGGADAGQGDGDDGAAVHNNAAVDISEAAGTACWLLAACSECVFGVDFALRSGEFGSGARAFVGHQDYVRGLEFTNEGTLLTVSDDSTAVEWSLATTNPIRQVKLHEGLVMSSAMSPTRSLLATGTDRGEIRVWRLPFATERIGGGV